MIGAQQVEHMRKLHDENIAAEQACGTSMDDLSPQVARKRLFAELSAAAFNTESAMSGPTAADDVISCPPCTLMNESKEHD